MVVLRADCSAGKPFEDACDNERIFANSSLLSHHIPGIVEVPLYSQGAPLPRALLGKPVLRFVVGAGSSKSISQAN
jgi:hypothetical protein